MIAAARRPVPVVLAGFMGAGKTAVGEILARRRAAPFLDMDAEIERDAGASVAAIFRDEGEAGFRARESALLRRLELPAGAVFATGGGAWLSPENRRRLLAVGVPVLLLASPEELAARLAGDRTVRPLLGPAPRAEEIANLLHERMRCFRAIRRRVETAGLSVAEVATRVESMIAEYRK